MKKTLFLLASAALLFAGCAKELHSVEGPEGEQTLTVNVGLNDSATKAVADYDGNAAKVNHWIFEVRDAQDKLFYREVKTPTDGTLQQTFTVTLIKNQSYNLLFWADNNSGYYNTDDLMNVTLADPSGYTANIDSRDAFTGCKAITSTASQQISLKLYRPFAQVNVITTDLETLWTQAATTGDQENTYMKFNPTDFIAKVKVPTSFNVLTQECGAADAEVEMTASESYTGYQSDNVTAQDKNNYALHVNPATLYMDYVFASKAQKDIVDIEFQFTSNSEDVKYSFNNVPLQANYRTNIKGKLLGNDTEVVVEIVPAWETPDYPVDLFETTISNIAALNDALASSEAGNADEVSATATMPTDSDTEKVSFTSNNDSQVINLTFEGELGTAKTIEFENAASAEGPSALNVVAPAGTTLIFNNPLTHVTINGTSYENVSGTFSAHSLIIPEGVVVNNLEIAAGGLEIYGTVNNVTVSGTANTVFVRNCVGLSEAVYTVLEPYIAKGFKGVEVSGSWNIVPGDNWAAYAAPEYKTKDAATKTIVIASAAQLALLSNDVSEGNTFEGWTIKLECDVDMAGHVFTPIGSFSPDLQFKGTFDGQGNTIKNLDVYTKDRKGNGLFGKVYEPCVLKNINVVDATVKAEGVNTYTGGLVGHGYAKIQNCTFKGDVYGGNQLAGIAASGGFTITDCTFEGNIYGKYWGIGALVGNCQDGGAISGNTAKGSIIAELETSNPFVAGGLIGCPIYFTTEIRDNYSAMNITFNGEPQTAYPIIGIYNIDNLGTGTFDPSALLTKISGNKWDKTIYTKDSYSLDYNNNAPAATGILINYDAACSEYVCAKIGQTGYSTLNAAIAAAITANDGVPVDIIDDITFSSAASWTPVNYPIGTLNINGNNHTITNLPGMLLSKSGSGGHYLKIEDLTFESPVASSTSDYCAVICGYADAMNELIFNNVKINNANVTSGKYAGAFIGYAAGWSNANDGPVYQQIKFNNCEVTNSTISAEGSVGSLIGHAAGNTWARIEVANSVISGNTVTSTGDSNVKAGSLFGTIGAAGISIEKEDAGIYVSATVSGNTVTSNGQTITTIYGRQGTSTGTLRMTEGGSYNSRPISESDSAWASCADGYTLVETDSTWSVVAQ